MNHLLRDAAPMSDAAWSTIDSEVREQLVPGLAARRLVDFSGPSGWEQSSVDLGHVTDVDAPIDALQARMRLVLPLVELRADFTVARSELRDIDRGAADLDLASADEAARAIAEAENGAVLHGWPTAGIVGAASASGTRRSSPRRSSPTTRSSSPRRSRCCCRRAWAVPTGSRSARPPIRASSRRPKRAGSSSSTISVRSSAGPSCAPRRRRRGRAQPARRRLPLHLG